MGGRHPLIPDTLTVIDTTAADEILRILRVEVRILRVEDTLSILRVEVYYDNVVFLPELEKVCVHF